MAHQHAGKIWNYFERPCGGNPIVGIDTPGFEKVQFVPMMYPRTFAEAKNMAKHDEINGRIANIRELVAYFAADDRHWFWVKTEPREDDFILTNTAAICTAERGGYLLSFDDSISAMIAPGSLVPRSDTFVVESIARAAKAGRRAEVPGKYSTALTANELRHPLAVAAFGDMAPAFEQFFRRDMEHHPKALEVLCMTPDELQNTGVTPETAYVAHVGLEATYRRCKLHVSTTRDKGDIVLVRPKYGFGKLQD